MIWGVVPVMNDEHTSVVSLFDSSLIKAKETGIINKGDVIVMASGSEPHTVGLTDTIMVFEA